MKKLLFVCFLAVLFVDLSANSQFAEERKTYANPTHIEKNPFVIKNNYVIVAGSAKVVGNRNHASIVARHAALNNLCKLKEQDFDFPAQYPILKRNIFLQYQSVFPIRFTAEKAIVIADYTRNGKYYYAVVYHMDNIKFAQKEKLTFQKVYNALKQAPGKRNELLFFEIIPQNELPALKDVVENNIAKQYGKTFALMFAGKDVPAITKEKYDRLKKNNEKYNSKTPLNILVIAANSLPYDEKICTLLAEKFDSMQMPRCASVMRKRATESNKLVVEIPPPPVVKTKPAVKEKSAVEEKNKVDAEPQKEQQEDKSTFQQILEFLNIVDSEPPKKAEKSVPPMTEEKTQAVKVEPVKVEEKQQAVNPEFFTVKEKPQAGKSNAPAAETNSGKKTKTTKPKQPASDVDFTNLL